LVIEFKKAVVPPPLLFMHAYTMKKSATPTNAANPWYCPTCGSQWHQGVVYCGRCVKKAPASEVDTSHSSVEVKNWFQGLGMPIIALHLLALGIMSGFAAIFLLVSSDMPLIGRVPLVVLFGFLGLVCSLVGAMLVIDSFQEYTLWIRFDQQITVRWLAGVFCYGHEEVKSVQIEQRTIPWGIATARERIFGMTFTDTRSATFLLKGDREPLISKAFQQQGRPITWP